MAFTHLPWSLINELVYKVAKKKGLKDKHNLARCISLNQVWSEYLLSLLSANLQMAEAIWSSSFCTMAQLDLLTWQRMIALYALFCKGTVHPLANNSFEYIYILSMS